MEKNARSPLFRCEQRFGFLACFRNPITVVTARMRLLSAEQGLLRAVDRFAISNENSLTMASLKSGSCEPAYELD